MVFYNRTREEFMETVILIGNFQVYYKKKNIFIFRMKYSGDGGGYSFGGVVRWWWRDLESKVGRIVNGYFS